MNPPPTPSPLRRARAGALRLAAIPLVAAGQCAIAPPGAAAPPQVYPVPQKITEQPGAFDCRALPAAARQAHPVVGEALAAAGVQPVAGAGGALGIVSGDAAAAVLAKAGVPRKPGAYFLSVSGQGIRIAATEDAGAFYAQQTLAQMIRGTGGRLPALHVADWPDVDWRGTVEGFYGAPWKHSARLAQISFYGRFKLNTYIYGPKDDPFHGFSNRWREPYPADKAAQIRALAAAARENHVHFVWAVHPGRDIRWTDDDGDGVVDDFRHCSEKFRMMHDLGVRAFAVFFDDIGGEGAKAEMQARMLNHLNRTFVRAHPGVAPLIMCPTDYSGAHASAYKTTLGAQLDPDIRIMWTGPAICSDITAESVRDVTPHWRRPPFIWWNWPVVDYCRTQLLLGRTYGPARENKGRLAGFVSNPMDKPEASKIALFGVADYCWNMGAFDSVKSWRDGIAILFPDYPGAMQVFASHNSDQGPNGHGYRREESVDLKPALDAAAAELEATGRFSPATSATLAREFEAIRRSADVLIERLPADNPELFGEIECWLRCFKALGTQGSAVLEMVASRTGEAIVRSANAAVAARREMDRVSALQQQRAADATTPGDRRWAKGCRTATRAVAPFIDAALAHKWRLACRDVFGKEARAAAAAPYRAFSDAPGLARVTAERSGIYVNLAPVLEPKTIPPGAHVGLELPEGVSATYVHVKLGNPRAGEQGVIEISQDGRDWLKMDTANRGEEMQGRLDAGRGIRFFRYRNTSNQPIEVRFNQFKFDVPEDSVARTREAMFDGDINSSFTIRGAAEVIQAPPGTTRAHVLAFPTASVTAIHADGATSPADRLPAGTPVTALSITPPATGTEVFEIIWQ